MKSIHRLTIVFLITLILAVLPLQQAYSQGGGFSISPENPEISYFAFTLNPGESAEDAINAKNFSSDRINMMVEVVEAQTALNGGLSYDFNKTGGASQWVTINSEKQFELRGSNVKRLPFTVTVPVGTAPGEYTIGFLGALVPTTPTPLPDGTSGGGYAVDVITRVAVTMVIRVPGELNCNAEFSKMEASVFDAEWRFETQIINTGNVHLKGNSLLKVFERVSGQKVAEATREIGYFAANSELITYNKFPVPQPGEYSYEYTLTDAKNPSCTFTTTGETSFGQAEQSLYATQATNVAIFNQPTNTPEPTQIPSPGMIQQVQTQGSIAWYVWLSVVFFLISLGFVIYALSILKKNKK